MNEPKDLNSIPVETIAGRIRPHLSDIDRRLKTGIKHRQIVAWLHGQGIDVSLHTFRAVLYDWRKRQISVSATPEPKDPKTPAKQQDKQPAPETENSGPQPIKGMIKTVSDDDAARYERVGKNRKL